MGVGCLYKFLDGIFQHDCTGDPKQLNPIMNFTGHFHDDSAGKGSVLVPMGHPGRDGQPTWIEEGINKLFGQNIHWCPGQNQFVLKVIGVGELSKPYCKLTQPTSMYATVSPHGTSEWYLSINRRFATVRPTVGEVVGLFHQKGALSSVEDWYQTGW